MAQIFPDSRFKPRFKIQALSRGPNAKLVQIIGPIQTYKS